MITQQLAAFAQDHRRDRLDKKGSSIVERRTGLGNYRHELQ